MNDSHIEWTDRFSDYLADDVDDVTRAGLEAHVAACGPCRRVLEELRDVVSRAHAVEELRPERDLWPGIAAAIGAPVRTRDVDRSGKVIALPTAAPGTGRGAAARRIAMTPRQLAAAAVVLITISAAATAWAGPGVGVRDQGSSAADVATVDDIATVTAAAATQPPPELSSELSQLEDVLDAARAQLDPNTVRVIERNLGVIEQAIADSRQALALDPGNEFLEHHLNRVYERKLEYLRDAARVIDWAG